MRKRDRGTALLLVLLLTLSGAWPAYAAEPETPPPAATEESGLPEFSRKTCPAASMHPSPDRRRIPMAETCQPVDTAAIT